MQDIWKRKAWTTIAQECVNKYNDTNHIVTGFSLTYLLYGTEVAILPNELKSEKSHSDWIEDSVTITTISKITQDANAWI